MLKEKTDIVVIGAGPAGAVAASKLCKEGFEVIVLERTEFPRFVIGESLLPHCMDFLQDIGVVNDIHNCGYQLKTGASFFNNDSVCEYLFSEKFTDGWDYTYQVKRADFDLLLINHAKKCGADVRFNSTVQNFERADDTSIVSYTDKNGNVYSIQSKFVIDASGYGRVLPRLLDLTVPTNSKPRGAIYAHFTDENKPEGAADNIYIHSFRNNSAWVWSIPFSDQTTSVGVVGDVEFIEQCSENENEEFFNIIKTFPFLSDRYRDSKAITPVMKTLNYSSSVKRLFGEGYVLCGNATEFLDPVFSSGVTLAVSSGHKAASLAISDLRGEKVDWKVEYEDYLLRGVDVFRTFVNAWYDGTLHTIFFAKDVNMDYKKKICSVLAGYVWDEKNPFVKNHKRAVRSLANAIKFQEA